MLWSTAALHEQVHVLHPGGSSSQRFLYQRQNVLPDLGPHFPEGTPQSPGVTFTQDGGVPVVVNEGEILAPSDEHWLLRVKDEIDGDLQVVGPTLNGAESRLAPVRAPGLTGQAAFAEDCHPGPDKDVGGILQIGEPSNLSCDTTCP